MDVDKQTKRAGHFLAAVWIILATVFFLIRFSNTFYEANKSPIDSLLERLFSQ